jgi:serine/threonine protein kinase/transcriptional regulator with XRE-family HTH domain
MGRRERPLEPGPLQEFAHDLRQLRATAGLTYRVMAERVRYSASALSSAASSRIFPSLAVTQAYVAACGGDVAEWERRWRAIAAWLRKNALEHVPAGTEEVDDGSGFALSAPPERVPRHSPRHAAPGSGETPKVGPAPRHARELPSETAPTEPNVMPGAAPGPKREPDGGRHRRVDVGYPAAGVPAAGVRTAGVRTAGVRTAGERAAGERAAGERPPDTLSATARRNTQLSGQVIGGSRRRDAASGSVRRRHALPVAHDRQGRDGTWHPRTGSRAVEYRPRQPCGAAGLERQGRPPKEQGVRLPDQTARATLPAVTPLRPGDPPEAGPIRLAARLGNAPVGRLYVGRDAAGQQVAVKVIHPGLSGNRYFRVRLAQELATLRAVRGPYVSSVTGGDVDGSPAWVAETYVPAVSLREAVRVLGPMRPETVRRLAAGIARALRDIHAANVMHHRLTPDNVLLTESGLLVTDFGMTAIMNWSGPGVIGVSPGFSAFLAPEQVVGGPAGMAADVFALGGLLVYALTGCAPFGDDRPEAVMARIIGGAPDLTAAAALDAHLAALITACLDKDPLARPRLTELRVQTGVMEPAEGWLPAPLADLVRRRGTEVAAALRKLSPDAGSRYSGRRGRRTRPGAAAASSAHGPRATGRARSRHRRTTPGTRPIMSRLTGGTRRRRHRRRDPASAASFWLAPLVLTLAIVTVFAIVAVNDGSTLNIVPAPAPTYRGHSTGSSTAQGQQPGGTAYPTGRPGSESQWTQPRKPLTRQSPSPQKTQGQQQRRPAVTFAATAGPFCPRTSSASTDAASSTVGIGWRIANAARAARDGCGDRFLFTPLAGHTADFELRENHFDWSFHTGRAAPVCTLSFFVPYSERANSDAVIWISNGSIRASYDPAYRIASFIINQADNRGQWLSVGPFAFPGGTVFAELINTGDGPCYGTVVASAVRVTCSGGQLEGREEMIQSGIPARR